MRDREELEKIRNQIMDLHRVRAQRPFSPHEAAMYDDLVHREREILEAARQAS